VTHEPEIAYHTRRIIHIRDGLITTDEAVSDSDFRRAELAEPTPVGAAA
jgi:ABC-type lipoprotein export system ATPase subunit